MEQGEAVRRREAEKRKNEARRRRQAEKAADVCAQCDGSDRSCICGRYFVWGMASVPQDGTGAGRDRGRGNEIYCRPPGFFCGAFRLQ